MRISKIIGKTSCLLRHSTFMLALSIYAKNERSDQILMIRRRNDVRGLLYLTHENIFWHYLLFLTPQTFLKWEGWNWDPYNLLSLLIASSSDGLDHLETHWRRKVFERKGIAQTTCGSQNKVQRGRGWTRILFLPHLKHVLTWTFLKGEGVPQRRRLM